MEDLTNKWLVIVNPKACLGKSEKDWPDIKQILFDEGIDFDAIVTEYPRHAIELVRDNITEKGYKKIISVGGDGTNNEVINGIFLQQRYSSKEITMGVIPVGTGNDWVRTFDFPLDYRKIVKIIKAKQVFQHDIGKVTYFNNGDPKVRYFLNAAGTGLDEMVCKKTNMLKEKGKGGKLNYLFSVITSLLKFKCTNLKIEINGETVFNDAILSLSLGNGRYNGGGMTMMPNAIPDDGMFDITAIRKLSLLKFVANVTKVYDGSFVQKFKEFSVFRGDTIRITSSPPHGLLLETEGETLSNSPFDFEMLPKAINMVVKQKAIRKAHLDAKKQEQDDTHQGLLQWIMSKRK